MKIAVAYLAVMVMVVGDELRSFVARGHSDDLSRALGVLQQRQRWLDAGLPVEVDASRHQYGTVTHFPPKMRKKSLSESGSTNIFDSVASIPPSDVWRNHLARETFNDDEDDEIDKRMKLKRSMFRERERKIEEEEKRRKKKKRMMAVKKSGRRNDWGDTESEIRSLAQRRFLDTILHDNNDSPPRFDTSAEIYGNDMAALVEALRNNMDQQQQHYMEGEGPGGESRKRTFPFRKRTMWQDGFRYALGDTPDKRWDDRENWYEAEDVPGPREAWWSYGNLSPEFLTALSEIKAAEERESDEEGSDEDDDGGGDNDDEESDERDLDERKREQDPWFPAYDVKKRGRGHSLWSAYNGYEDDRLIRKRLIPLKRKRSSAFRERSTHDPGITAFVGASKRAATIKRSPEEPIEVHKRMVKKSSETKPHVLKELKSILADDKDEKRVIKKREDGNQSDDSGEDATGMSSLATEDDSEEEDLSEEDINNIFYNDIRKRSISRKKKRSWDDYFGIDKRQGRSINSNHKMKKDDGESNTTKTIEKTTPDNATMAPLLPTPLPQTDNSANSWVMNRYFKSMAAAMSSKRKRTVAVEKKAVEDEEDGGSGQTSLQTMAQKLEAIENLMLEEALELVEGHGAGDGSEREEKREEILHRLDAAQSLVKMREALAEFEDSLGRIRDDEKSMKSMPDHQTEEEDEDDDDDENKKRKKDVSKKQNLVEALHVMAPKTTKRVSQSGEDNSVDSKTECPIFSEIALLCSELSKAAGDPQRELVGACSRHIMCYACDYAYKDGPRLPCDLIFMRDAHDICGDDLYCRSAAAQMHGTLRQRAPAIEHSSAPVCLSEPCIRAYRRR